MNAPRFFSLFPRSSSFWAPCVLLVGVFAGCGSDSDSGAAGAGAGGQAGSGGGAAGTTAAGAAGTSTAGASGTGGTSAAGSAGGGAAGAAGKAGTAGTATACKCGEPGCGQCPTNAMVGIDGMYEIDAAEVTKGQYAEFVASGPAPVAVHERCSYKKTNTPTCAWPPAGDENLPVVCVDWCNAFAYCQWAGKHLCGKIGGGENAQKDLNDPAKSEWYRACAGPGMQSFTYGDTQDAAICNGPGNKAAWDGATSTCKSSLYPGVVDLSGNVEEWEASCDVQTGVPPFNDNCQVRGGNFLGSGTKCSTNVQDSRSTGSTARGFRCCR